MSYSTWSCNGYGIKISEGDISPSKLVDFLKKYFPDFCESGDAITEDNVMDTVRYEFENTYSYSCCGVASVLAEVIRRDRNIVLEDFQDWDGNIYLLYTPKYPWSNISSNEKEIQTREDIINLIGEYWTQISYAPMDIDYWDVQNGG